MGLTLAIFALFVGIGVVVFVKQVWIRITAGAVVVGLGLIWVLSTLAATSAPGAGFYFGLIFGLICLGVSDSMRHSKNLKGKVPDYAPTLVGIVAWFIILFAFLTSGFGQWTQATFGNLNLAAYCDIDANQDKKTCVERRAKKVAEKRIRTTQRAVVAPLAPVPKAPDAEYGCNDYEEYADKTKCHVVTLYFGGERHLLSAPEPDPDTKKERCWQMWSPFEDAVDFAVVPNGTEAWAKSRDVKMRFFQLEKGVVFKDRFGHKYKCP